MNFRVVKDGYLVRLEKGEKVLSSLTGFVKQHNIPAGWITGMGAFAEATIGIFEPEKKEYFKKEFQGDLEVGNLTGNISWLEETGEPFVHAHVTIADHSLCGCTGHLFEAVVSVTLEVYIKTFEEKLIRIKDHDMGFNFWQL